MMDVRQAEEAAPSDLFDLFFRSGLTTRETVGEFSGRGTKVRIRLPISVAVPSTGFLSGVET